MNFQALLQLQERSLGGYRTTLKFNPNHDPANGRFTSGTLLGTSQDQPQGELFHAKLPELQATVAKLGVKIADAQTNAIFREVAHENGLPLVSIRSAAEWASVLTVVGEELQRLNQEFGLDVATAPSPVILTRLATKGDTSGLTYTPPGSVRLMALMPGINPQVDALRQQGHEPTLHFGVTQSNPDESPFQVAKNVFRHELGHALTPEHQINTFARLLNNNDWSPKWFAEQVSDYAATNIMEAIAESFSLYTHPRYQPGRLPEPIESFLRGMLRPAAQPRTLLTKFSRYLTPPPGQRFRIPKQWILPTSPLEDVGIEFEDIPQPPSFQEILKYSESQPREPAGSPQGGQFVSGGGGTVETRETLHRIEDEIRGQDYETLVGLQEGKVLFRKDGDHHSVHLSKDELEELRWHPGASFTHNHPSGSSFSVSDIQLALLLKMWEMRAAGKKGTYYLRITDWNSDTPYLQRQHDLEQAYYKAVVALNTRLSDTEDYKGLTPAQLLNVHWQGIAKIMGWEYGFEPKGGKGYGPLLKWDPSQPRVPAGSSEGGQFASSETVQSSLPASSKPALTVDLAKAMAHYQFVMQEYYVASALHGDNSPQAISAYALVSSAIETVTERAGDFAPALLKATEDTAYEKAQQVLADMQRPAEVKARLQAEQAAQDQAGLAQQHGDLAAAVQLGKTRFHWDLGKTTDFDSHQGQQLAKLTKDEIYFLQAYTQSDYHGLNKYVGTAGLARERGQPFHNTDAGGVMVATIYRTMGATLDRVLGNSTLGANLYLRRNMATRYLQQQMGPDPRQWVGKIYKEHAYASTSLKRGFTEAFSNAAMQASDRTTLVIRARKDSPGLSLMSGKGITNHLAEFEVLLPRGMTYRVRKVTQEKFGWRVEVDTLGSFPRQLEQP